MALLHITHQAQELLNQATKQQAQLMQHFLGIDEAIDQLRQLKDNLDNIITDTETTIELQQMLVEQLTQQPTNTTPMAQITATLSGTQLIELDKHIKTHTTHQAIHTHQAIGTPPDHYHTTLTTTLPQLTHYVRILEQLQAQHITTTTIQ